jgi:hypothetical protein
VFPALVAEVSDDLQSSAEGSDVRGDGAQLGSARDVVQALNGTSRKQ